MDYITALQKSHPRLTRDLPAKPLSVYSPWETKTLEIFLKAHAAIAGHRLEIRPSGFGSLWIDLQELENSPSEDQPPILLLLDDELFVPGCNLRSDVLLKIQDWEQKITEARERISRLRTILENVSAQRRVIVSPLLADPSPILQRDDITCSLTAIRGEWHDLIVRLSDSKHIEWVKPPTFSHPMGSISGLKSLDDKLLFQGGWPFTITATAECAALLWNAIQGSSSCEPQRTPHTPAKHSRGNRKLIVTDADGTLWRGIVGDEGVRQVSWAQDAETYRFFIYQNSLNFLMSEGILVALATKNSPEPVSEAFARKDFVLQKENLVSKQISWQPKSEMVREILKETHLLPSAVVFVDDSDFELGEVKTAFPEIQCLKFPGNNVELRPFLNELQLCFERKPLTNEDRKRAFTLLQTIRFQEDLRTTDSLDNYLESLGMRASLERVPANASDRALQLLNKTNQFNLRGHHFTEKEWKALLDSPDRLLFQVSFRDRLADYGIISVLITTPQGCITDWVLSCRVFSRSLEAFILNEILETLGKQGAPELKLCFQSTGRNGPILDFLKRNAEGKSGTEWIVRKPLPSHVHKQESNHA